nr:MAG TPA: hypothetical protein [Caudoviricetes sp.]
MTQRPQRTQRAPEGAHRHPHGGTHARELVKCGLTNFVNFYDPLSYLWITLCITCGQPVDNF